MRKDFNAAPTVVDGQSLRPDPHLSNCIITLIFVSYVYIYLVASEQCTCAILQCLTVYVIE